MCYFFYFGCYVRATHEFSTLFDEVFFFLFSIPSTKIKHFDCFVDCDSERKKHSVNAEMIWICFVVCVIFLRSKYMIFFFFFFALESTHLLNKFLNTFELLFVFFLFFRVREIAFWQLYLPMHAIVLVDDQVQWKRVDVIVMVYQRHDVHQMVFSIHALMEFLMMPCHLIVSIRVQSAR